MNHSLISRDNFKLNFADTATTDDAIYRRVLEAVTEQIEQECHRTFRSYTATQVYTGRSGSKLTLPPGHDLLSVTSLKTDSDGDEDFDDTWATTDYVLEPANAPNERRPYWWIRTKDGGDYSFPGSGAGIQLIGKFGYWEQLETIASTTAEVLDASETGVDVTAGTDFDVLDTILVDSEQMYVTAISTNTLTVVRGVNGTTAATHITASVIQRYQYPAPVVEACGLQAARIFMRKGAPFGVLGSADVGFMRLHAKLDPDVQLLLDPFRLVEVG